MSQSARENLAEGLLSLGLPFSETDLNRLMDLLSLLKRWNRVHNLTAVTHLKEMVDKHLLDSLVAYPYLKGAKRVCDVGTGPGFPGLPLAVFLPGVEWCLLDAVLKKVQFVQQAIIHLDLKHVCVEHARVETFQPTSSFDWIISRAMTNLRDLLEKTPHLLAKGGRYLAFKARLTEEERRNIPAHYQIVAIHPVSLPFTAERVLVEIAER